MNAHHSTFSRSENSAVCGFTLMEVMLSVVIGAAVLFGVVITFSTLNRSFQAALYQMDSQGDESRVLAYLSRDLHQASSVQMSAGGTALTLSIPMASTPTLNVNLGLPLLSLLNSSSTSPAVSTVQYYRQGSTIIRDTGSTTTALSSSATSFQVTKTGGMVRVDLAFQPRFSIAGASATSPSIAVSAYVDLLNAR
jgi:type II secretory pathway component PulJ